jgi:ribosomal protein S18 acetylase RimI-like enzyme
VLSVRRYRPGDRQTVWDLHNLALHDAQAHGGNGPWDADLQTIEASYLGEGGEFLVGTIDDQRVVAMGALRRLSPERAVLTRMRVHPTYQRRGFGRRILHELERTATRLGYSSLALDTTIEQTAAQALYRAEGYRETGRGRLGRFEVVYFAKSPLPQPSPPLDAMRLAR